MTPRPETTPAYAVSPHHPPLSPSQEDALAAALGPRLCDGGTVVITACSTAHHHLIEVTTAAGPVMIIAPVMTTAPLPES